MTKVRYSAFEYAKGLKKKLDNNQELTEEEKDNLFEILGEGHYRIVREGDSGETIDFSNYLHRYLWLSECTSEASTWSWSTIYDYCEPCYSPDKETIARYYNDECLLIANLSDLILTYYKRGKFFMEEKGENDRSREL